MNTLDEAWKDLANAIVEQACTDLAILRLGIEGQHYQRGKYLNEYELRKFFKSDWFQMLSDLEGDKLHKSICERCKGVKFRYNVVKVPHRSRWHIVDIKHPESGAIYTFDNNKDAISCAADMTGVSYGVYKMLRDKYRRDVTDGLA